MPGHGSSYLPRGLSRRPSFLADHRGHPASPPPPTRQAAVNKVTNLNRKALEAYNKQDYETARALLKEALEVCASAGLDKHAIRARTHIHFGVVAIVGFKQREVGLKQFRKALEVQPDIKLTKQLATPELQDAFEEAVLAGEGGGGGGGRDRGRRWRAGRRRRRRRRRRTPGATTTAARPTTAVKRPPPRKKKGDEEDEGGGPEGPVLRRPDRRDRLGPGQGRRRAGPHRPQARRAPASRWRRPRRSRPRSAFFVTPDPADLRAASRSNTSAA